MADKVLTMYLAGAIRDDRPEDIEWREQVIAALKGLPVRILNPLAGKSYEGGQWTVSGVPSSAKFITQHDRWCVRQSDIVLFNFRALSQGYPNIGTLVEFGMSVNNPTSTLIYAIVDPDYRGHENQRMYKLHPFLDEFSAQVFPDTATAIEFLKRHLKALTGRNASFGQVGGSADVRRALEADASRV